MEGSNLVRKIFCLILSHREHFLFILPPIYSFAEVVKQGVANNFGSSVILFYPIQLLIIFLNYFFVQSLPHYFYWLREFLSSFLLVSLKILPVHHDTDEMFTY
jgi:hypothetical protein